MAAHSSSLTTKLAAQNEDGLAARLMTALDLAGMLLTPVLFWSAVGVGIWFML